MFNIVFNFHSLVVNCQTDVRLAKLKLPGELMGILNVYCKVTVSNFTKIVFKISVSSKLHTLIITMSTQKICHNVKKETAFLE